MSGVAAIAAATLVGAVAGSFAVTAAIRVAREERWMLGRSRCDGCGAMLSFAETAPVYSYVKRRGACHRCGGRIDPTHLAGELAGGAVVASAFCVADPLRAVALAALGLVLLAAATVDLRVRRLPNPLVAVAALLGLGLSAGHGASAFLIGLMGAAGAGGLLLLVRRASTLGGKAPGLGLGDVKLTAALATWLGTATPLMVSLAAILGLMLAPRLRGADGRLPFGPMIAAAAWLVGLAHERGAFSWAW